MRALCFVLALLAGLAPPAAGLARPNGMPGQIPCHDYRSIVETLDKRYGESPVSLGRQSNGHMLQIFTSPASGSWTILSVSPDGIGCIIAAGHGWRSREPAHAFGPVA